ncbi:MAG: hypothetical protein RMK97_10935 [Sutterellaceae bacterium]|nr:hypothetical protein [Burkholderiaceae bacterium]MDW8430994.1 hypothetical protein [Sutterellaceae bacterium]
MFPLEGAVPAGLTIVSADDPSLRASILSRWPDGSAAVVVVAGETALTANSARTVRLTAGAPSGGAALTAARIGQLIASVVVDCGSVGAASITNFENPAFVWWSNERVICARYRAPVGTHPTLEAVVDIHAFAGGRVFVEVVVENGKVNSSAPASPAAIAYNATVRVNGIVVASMASSSAPGGQHQPFRAWYASAWVGGDPGVELGHDPAALQAHPLFMRCWKAATFDMSAYAADTYVPWSTGRHRATNMGAGGDHPSIGPLPQWETRYLQSGDPRARRAVLASALAVLTYNVNYRDSNTGLVPDFNQLADRSLQYSSGPQHWPSIGGEPAWEIAHHPAAGLMAFLCRPSPVFIEIAQKISVWNHVWKNRNAGTMYGDVRWSEQIRGKAWAMRSLAHALFLTPEALRGAGQAQTWRYHAQQCLYYRVLGIKRYVDDARAKLNFTWDYEIDSRFDHDSGVAGFQQSLWQHHYLLVELHKIAAAKLLSGSQQATLQAVADWCALQPVRYVNEAPGGAWRIHYYKMTVGRDGGTIDSAPTYNEQLAWQYRDSPPPLAGPWMLGSYSATSYGSATPYQSPAGAYYPEYFWAALVAAVERNVPGADAAWNKVTGNVTNLASWSAGFANDPRWGVYPRNK